MTRAECPKCGYISKLPEKAEGRRIRCRDCGEIFSVFGVELRCAPDKKKGLSVEKTNRMRRNLNEAERGEGRGRGGRRGECRGKVRGRDAGKNRERISRSRGRNYYRKDKPKGSVKFVIGSIFVILILVGVIIMFALPKSPKKGEKAEDVATGKDKKNTKQGKQMAVRKKIRAFIKKGDDFLADSEYKKAQNLYADAKSLAAEAKESDLEDEAKAKLKSENIVKPLQGYVRHAGKWVAEAERKRILAENTLEIDRSRPPKLEQRRPPRVDNKNRGKVLFDGEWVTLQRRKELEKERLAAMPDPADQDEDVKIDLGEEKRLFGLAREKAEQCIERAGGDIKNRGIRVQLSFIARSGDYYLFKTLMDMGADVTSADRSGQTLMFAAAPYIKIVKLLASKGVEPNAKTSLGYTPLYYAAEKGTKGVISFFISKGADPKIQIKKSKETPLHNAAKGGNLETAKVLIKYGADVTARNSRGRTPLHAAVDNKNAKYLVKLLLDKGADVNAVNESKETPLLCAVNNASTLEGNKDTVEVLLDNGADVNFKDEKGRTPVMLAQSPEKKNILDMLLKRGGKKPKDMLHLAAKGLDEYKVAKLLEEGEDVDGYDDKGWTPLHYVLAQSPANKKVKIWNVTVQLVRKGANVNAKAKDEYGRTPISYAISSGNPNMVEFLLDNGADANVQSGGGMTPLLYAADSGGKYAVELLLNKGADANAKTDSGFTPLHYAARSGSLDSVRLLLDNGANIDEKNKDGETPLCGAIYKFNKSSKTYEDRIGILELLLSKGANANAETNRGSTPLMVAKKYKNEDVLRLLKKHGAK